VNASLARSSRQPGSALLILTITINGVRDTNAKSVAQMHSDGCPEPGMLILAAQRESRPSRVCSA